MSDRFKDQSPRPGIAARGLCRVRALGAGGRLSARCCPAARKRDSITVGAVPDDYRTNHPIVIGEKEEVLDLPVGAGDRGMTEQQRESLEGFWQTMTPAPRRC